MKFKHVLASVALVLLAVVGLDQFFGLTAT